MFSKYTKGLSYLAVTASSLCYCGSVVTVQLLGTAYPRFELNLFRFISQLLVCCALVLILQLNIFEIRGYLDISALIAASCSYTWCVLTVNLAPLYAPVGNLEGVAITVLIVLSVLVALLQCTASRAVVIAAVLSCVGVVFLTQPEFMFPHVRGPVFEKDPCPCAALQDEAMSSRIEQCQIPDSITVTMVTPVSHTLDSTRLSQRHTRNNTATPDVSLNSTAPHSPDDQHSPIPAMDRETFGYLLMVSTGLSLFIMIQINHKILLPKYNHVVVSFWMAAIGTSLSVILMVALETPRVVGGYMCVMMFLLHALFASGLILLFNAGLKYVSAEESAILQTVCVVTLFIAQCTFLVQFEPPKGNAFEYIGATLIVIACLLEPLCKIIIATRKRNLKKEANNSHKNVSMWSEKALNEETFLLSSKDHSVNSMKYSTV